MGTKGRAIVGLDLEKIVDVLNRAYADEWLAHYQYWLGAKVVKGPMKDAVIAELLQHATDEMTHATMVADRIIQLGGTPVITPKKWFDYTNCGYDAPEDEYVRTILDQNVKGEQCAIDVYSKMLDLVNGKDYVTYNMALQILQDEVEHEEDLQALVEDLESFLASK